MLHFHSNVPQSKHTAKHSIKHFPSPDSRQKRRQICPLLASASARRFPSKQNRFSRAATQLHRDRCESGSRSFRNLAVIFNRTRSLATCNRSRNASHVVDDVVESGFSIADNRGGEKIAYANETPLLTATIFEQQLFMTLLLGSRRVGI